MQQAPLLGPSKVVMVQIPETCFVAMFGSSHEVLYCNRVVYCVIIRLWHKTEVNLESVPQTTFLEYSCYNEVCYKKILVYINWLVIGPLYYCLIVCLNYFLVLVVCITICCKNRGLEYYCCLL